MLFSSVIFTGCGGDHECKFAEAWSYNETKHWHKCEENLCDKVDGEAEHNMEEAVDENGNAIIKCSVCGYAEENSHVCKFVEKFSYDEQNHWRKCEIEGCEKVSEKAPHAFAYGKDDDGNDVMSCACGYAVKSDKSHEHSYGETAKYNEKYHWYDCSDANCKIKKGYAEHTFGNPEETFGETSITRVYTCTICAFSKTETITVDSVVDDARVWYDVFENIDRDNYSMIITFKEANEKGEEYVVGTNEACVTENGMYLSWASGLNEYYLKNDEGKFDRYYKYRNEGWSLTENADAYYKDLHEQTKLSFSFKEDFQKFSFNKENGTYVCADEIETTNYGYEDGQKVVLCKVICSNLVVKVADGKLVYIEADYYIIDESSEEAGTATTPATKPAALNHFKYYNIGSSEVSLPKDVLDLIEARTKGTTGKIAND